MCGIAGILKIHKPGEPPPSPLVAIPESWLDILDESIKHRGPDGQGRFRDRAVREDGTVVDIALVHRRLSIIDHEGGAQPMVHDGQRLRPDLTYQPGEEPKLAHELAPDVPLVAVVFNGCVYNHQELRAELEAAGHQFCTDHSDTECWIHGWRQWACDVTEKVDGMYAIATWDRSACDLALARDNFGEKPLYRTVRNADKPSSMFTFSSSAASLTQLQATQRSMPPTIETDDAALIRAWIKFGWNQLDILSSFRPAYVGSSELILVRDFQMKPRNPEMATNCGAGWWFHARQPGMNELTPSEVDRTLREAVQSCLEADVPVGVFLSGGIDSSLIARYASEVRPDIKTFTVRMPVGDLDETQAAAAVAHHLGIRHEILDCDPDPAQDVVRLIQQLGFPFGDSSLLPSYWVSRAARGRVKVALSGDGGDELFLGYDRHRAIHILSSLSRLPLPVRMALARLVSEGRNPKSIRSRMARLLNAASHCGYKELVAIFAPPFDQLLGLTPQNRKRIPTDHTHLLHLGQTNGGDELSALRFDRMFYLPEDLLRKSDSASMSTALEVRTPFLAHDVADLAFNASVSSLMPNGQRKGLLRAVARKYFPSEIVDRPKMGFAIPIGEWFRSDYGGMRQLLYDHLESSDPFPGLADSGVNINMKFVQQMLHEHDAAGEKSLWPWKGRDHSQRLYMLLVLSIWAKWMEGIGIRD